MTRLEDALLGYVVDYIDVTFFGNMVYAAVDLDTTPSNLYNWQIYYISDGAIGRSPRLDNLSNVITRIGRPIEIDSYCITNLEEDDRNPHSIYETFMRFVIRYVDKQYNGSTYQASRALGITAHNLSNWLTFYKTKGEQGHYPKLNIIAPVLEKLGVTINTPTFDELKEIA